jgi:hypothetical protein
MMKKASDLQAPFTKEPLFLSVDFRISIWYGVLHEIQFIAVAQSFFIHIETAKKTPEKCILTKVRVFLTLVYWC